MSTIQASIRSNFTDLVKQEYKSVCIYIYIERERERVFAIKWSEAIAIH